MYADTDFFLALFKESDWLKHRAEMFLKKYEDGITASVVTVIEILLTCERYRIDPEEALLSIFQIAKVEGIAEEQALAAAHFMKEKGLNVFDALHASFCNGELISSDHAYDKLHINRIRLEANE